MLAREGLRSRGTITIFYDKLVDDDKLAWPDEDRHTYFGILYIVCPTGLLFTVVIFIFLVFYENV